MGQVLWLLQITSPPVTLRWARGGEGCFESPPPFLWTPPTPQRERGSSPLSSPCRRKILLQWTGKSTGSLPLIVTRGDDSPTPGESLWQYGQQGSPPFIRPACRDVHRGLLGPRPARCERRSRRETDAGCRNPCSLFPCPKRNYRRTGGKKGAAGSAYWEFRRKSVRPRRNYRHTGPAATYKYGR